MGETAIIETDIGVVEFLGGIDPDSLPAAGKPDREFPFGLFSFLIEELNPAGGDTVTVTITLPLVSEPR